MIGNKWFYAGEVRAWCECHGFTRGWSVKVHNVFGITIRKHAPRVIFRFGQDAKIVYATPERWKMAGDRIP